MALSDVKQDEIDNDSKQDENESIAIQKKQFPESYPLSLLPIMYGPEKYENACHWLIRDLVLIGEYPLTLKYIDHLIQKEGICNFVCMVDLDQEVKQYDLTNYWKEWIVNNKQYKDLRMDLLQSPIHDFSVSDDKTMIGFLEKIVKHIMNGWMNGQKNKYYMHCMTGHGRTGLISVLLLMCLYRIDWQNACDLIKLYHQNRDCVNGDFFYNSCGASMAIKDKKYNSKKYSLQAFYPMPQERSQFKQIQRLQGTMHAIHDKHVLNVYLNEK